MIPSPPRRILSLLLFAPQVFLSACGAGGGGGSSGAQASGDFLITDAPRDDLLSFAATIDALRLERSDGTLGGDLLAVDVTVEFLGLDGAFAWLAGAALAPGSYSAVEVSFEPFGYAARAMDGSSVTVNALSDVLRVELAAPLVVDANGYARFEIDLDLLAALDGDVASGTIVFDPVGSLSSNDGSEDAPIDEIKGIVRSADALAGTLVLDAFVDDQQTIPLGEVTVQVGPSALLLDDDGTVFSSRDAFFAALVPDTTLLEVHGALSADGQVDATRIEVEDGIGGGSALVRIEGLIVGLGASDLELLIIEIEDGAAVAAPVLAALGDPSSILCSFDASTVFLLEEDQLTTSASLAVGQEVKARFLEFASEPFPVREVEIEGANPEFEGVITDLSGLPDTFVIHLVGDEPAILSGDVASTATDVTVSIDGAPLFLDVESEPNLSSSDLLVGLKVQPEGTLSGPPDAPAIAAAKIKIFAGRLRDADVQAVDSLAATFDTVGGEIDDPFGETISPGPLHVVLDPSCAFEGDASSSASFFALFDGLGSTQTLRVEVGGRGTGAPSEIRAYEIEVMVSGN
jgi:hypothetical protein